ncbi:hypothetical protein MWU59_06330 [Flavobacteriaceae bacterium F08102]|nr:hypothetical protein [Flavobacteriaceae bacterium F08102]
MKKQPMKRFLLLLICSLSLTKITAQEEPDYTKIRFKSYLKEYKKDKPDETQLKLTKDELETIVTLLGDQFYSETEIEDITEKIWLALRDPEKFDYVFKDLAVRSLPDWSKPNYKGEIVIEPFPYRKFWTKAVEEVPYYQETIGRLLTYYGLMGYSEDAKSTKSDLKKLKYTHKMAFRPVRSNDWTSAYLNSVNEQIKRKGLSVQLAGFHYFVCLSDKKDDLVSLFSKLEMEFETPVP